MPHLDTLLPYLKSNPHSQNEVHVIRPESSAGELLAAAKACTLSPGEQSQVCALIMQMVSEAVPVEGIAFKSRYICNVSCILLTMLRGM
jgi:hypothetical protein